MDDFDAALTERVLAGSGVHVQWNRHIRGWRWLPDAALERIRARGMEPVGWSPWTGSPGSFAHLSIARNLARWCVLVGELPSPGSGVVVKTDHGDQLPADSIEGQLWVCEWAGPPLSATVSIDGGAAIAVSFFHRLPRKLHFGTEQPGERAARPGMVLRGLYLYSSKVRPET
jgi:hypothetical protein